MRTNKRKLGEYSTHELAEEVARRTDERAMVNLRTKSLNIVNNRGYNVEVSDFTQDSCGGITIIFEVNGGAQ